MSYAYLGDFPDDGDFDSPHDSMPADAFCDERCFWCGERPDPGMQRTREPQLQCDSCGRFMSKPAKVVPVRDSVHPYTADVINLCGRCADARA
jgi:hypothetical protein